MSCADILSEGPAYHIAWLNSSDAQGGFLQVWAAQGCLDEVSRSLGARIEFLGVRHPASARAGETVEVEVMLRNTGWARAFGPRALVVSLVDGQTGREATRATGPLLASLEAQGTAAGSTAPPATWKVAVTLPGDAAPGRYDLYLSMPDGFAATAGDPRFAMRPANADVPSRGQAWNEQSARYRAGTALALQ
jgi:hypothetical protein